MNDDRPEPIAPSSEGIADVDRSAFTFAWGLLLVLLISFVLIGGTMQALHPPYGIWFTELVLFFGLTWMALRHTGRHPLHYPRFGVPGGKVLGLSFLAGTFNFFAVVIPLQVIAQSLFPRELVELFDGSRIFARQRPIDLGFIVAGVGFAAPICEEYFFRGVLLRGMTAVRMKVGAALFVTAFVFSAFHLDPVGFAARFELGVLFGYLYLRTGSLWPAVMAHAANNLVSTATYFVADAIGGANDDPPTLLPLAVMVLFFGMPLYAVLLWFSRRGPMLATGPDRTAPGIRWPEVTVWIGAAVVSFGLLLAIDSKTVLVNGSELWIGVEKPAKTAPTEAHEAFHELERLGKAARQGELPLERYLDARRDAKVRLSRFKAQGRAETKEDHPASQPPAPPPVPVPPQP